MPTTTPILVQSNCSITPNDLFIYNCLIHVGIATVLGCVKDVGEDNLEIRWRSISLLPANRTWYELCGLVSSDSRTERLYMY